MCSLWEVGVPRDNTLPLESGTDNEAVQWADERIEKAQLQENRLQARRTQVFGVRREDEKLPSYAGITACPLSRLLCQYSWPLSHIN